MNKEGLLIISIFILAFIVRIILIGTYLGQDEVYYVGYANDIINNRPYTSAYSPLFYYFLAPFITLFNNSEILIHMLMALLGALNVALVYFIGSKFIGRRAGIIAALLLAFNTTHWFFSEFAMLDMPVAFFSTIALYFYWSGYARKSGRSLALAAAFGSVAILTKYGFFASVAMLGYLVLFDRKKLRDKRLLVSIIAPFVIFGMWMLYFINQQGWLWNWWSNYIQGGTGLASPYYQYFAATWYEFLLPIPALFVIFLSAYELTKKWVKHKQSWMFFLAAFIVASVYSFFNMLPLQTQAILGVLAIALPSLVLVKSKFQRFAILYVASVFIFYSALALKFPRYVLPALPGLYLLIGGLVSMQKNKFFIVAAVVVIALFAAYNIIDTVNKLILDQHINSVKYEAQQYIINSSPCSSVYSKTWYGFYYLRTKITDLPSSAASVKNCECPPYFISEGPLDQRYASQLQKEQVFPGSSPKYVVDATGISTSTVALTPIEVYAGICSS